MFDLRNTRALLDGKRRAIWVSVLILCGLSVGAGFGTRNHETPPVSAQTSQPSGCVNWVCSLVEEALTTKSCVAQNGFQPVEFVMVRATRLSPSFFRARVCLVDFSNVERKCEEIEIPSSVTSENRLVKGPVGVNIWKVRWYFCSGSEGTIEIVSNDCLYACCTEEQFGPLCEDLQGKICPSQPCREKEMPDLYFDRLLCIPQTQDCNTYVGQHHVKIQLTNNTLQCRRIQYWWDTVSNCQMRSGPVYGISVMPGQTIFLCQSMGLFSHLDYIRAFRWTDLTPDGGPGANWSYLPAGDRCCPVGQPCTDRIPWNPATCVSPFGLPSCP